MGMICVARIAGIEQWFVASISQGFSNLHNHQELEMDVSLNGGTPKSSILIGVSILNHPFWGTPIFRNPQMNDAWKRADDGWCANLTHLTGGISGQTRQNTCCHDRSAHQSQIAEKRHRRDHETTSRTWDMLQWVSKIRETEEANLQSRSLTSEKAPAKHHQENSL